MHSFVNLQKNINKNKSLPRRGFLKNLDFGHAGSRPVLRAITSTAWVVLGLGGGMVGNARRAIYTL